MSKSPREKSEGKNLGRAYLKKQLGERGLSRRRSLRVLNHLFKQMNLALARGEEVEFAGGRLLRVDPAKVSQSCYDEDNWPAHWPLWTVVWVPHWATLIRMVGVEEAWNGATDFFFDQVFVKELEEWFRAERKREAERRKESGQAFVKKPKKRRANW